MTNAEKTLAQAVAAKPFPEFGAWWPMGEHFTAFMANAIVGEWAALVGNTGDLTAVTHYVQHYLSTVYQRAMRPELVMDFVDKAWRTPLQSGEFDALSYAFYHAAFDFLTAQADYYAEPLARERRLFTKRVGKRFYDQVHEYIQPQLPATLERPADFAALQKAICQVGEFLQREGYLRDHFGFPFTVHVTHGGQRIDQDEADFLPHLRHNGMAYALYEMGYPAILPSAVYLYHTVGEAQHHSSRTIEELFDRIGYTARETDDFDPTGFPAEMVVELWEIRPQEG
ncbi:MAG: hypothetical protein R3C14_01550 [Caldilineaceae bacterium]